MNPEEVQQETVPAAGVGSAMPKPRRVLGLQGCCGLHHPVIPK